MKYIPKNAFSIGGSRSLTLLQTAILGVTIAKRSNCLEGCHLS
jgi:hypothetical protein